RRAWRRARPPAGRRAGGRDRGCARLLPEAVRSSPQYLPGPARRNSPGVQKEVGPVCSAPMAVATEREDGLFINGEATEASAGEPLAKAAMAGEEDVERAVEAARAALDGDWARTPPTERSRLLHALADALVANRKELAELEARNVGKAISSVKAELAQAI